jgi:hypothetical protein
MYPQSFGSSESTTTFTIVDWALEHSELHTSRRTSPIFIVDRIVFFVYDGVLCFLKLRSEIVELLCLVFSHEHFFQFCAANLALSFLHNESNSQAASNAHVLVIADTNKSHFHYFLAQNAVLQVC